MRRRSLTRSVIAILLVTAMALAVPPVPLAGAEPVVIDEFVGGLDNATLGFTTSIINGTLAIEVPAGATIMTATVVVEGVSVTPPAKRAYLDWYNGTMFTDVDAYMKEGENMYPPSVDPDNHQWNQISRTGTRMISLSDDMRWETDTAGDHKAPYSYPFQMYRFVPTIKGMESVTLMWEGFSECDYNQTNEFHAEMWLYNHTDDEWIMVEEYGQAKAGDVWLNHTVDLPSPYVKADGTLDFIIVGNHDETGPQSAVDDGHLRSDYAAVEAVSFGTPQWPSDVRLSVSGTNVATLTGELHDAVIVGDDEDLTGALQAVLDTYAVGPYNVTIPLELHVGDLTFGQVHVQDLRVTYEPVVNLAPAYEGPDAVQVAEDSQWTAVLDLDDVFDDDHDLGSLSFDMVDAPAEVDARLGVGPGGNATLELKPAHDFYGDASGQVAFSAEDAFGLLTVARIDVTVTPVADRPRIEPIPQQEVPEGSELRYTVNVTDPDMPDDELAFRDDTLLFEIDMETGEVVWTPGDEHVGAHQVEISVTDSHGLSDSAIMRIVVTNVNDPPVLTVTPVVHAVQDVAESFYIGAEDPDVPAGDDLTFWANSEALDLQVNPTTGLVTFTPRNDDVPGFDILVRVTDSAGERDEATVHVNVQNVNDPPAFSPMADPEYDQGDLVAFWLAASDPDLGLDIDPPEALVFSGSGPEWLMPSEDGYVSLTLDQSMIGEHQVTYKVTDSEGASDILTLTWTINDVNDAPIISTQVPASQEAPEDAEFTLSLEAQDMDGDDLTWSDDTGLFSIDSATGAIAFTPLQTDVGTYQVTVTVSDGRGGEASVSFELVVTNVNDDPVIGLLNPASGAKYDEGETVSCSAVASDEDGDELTYTWTRGGKQLGTGAFLRLKDLSPGKHTLTLTVTDGNGGEASANIDIEVREAEGGIGAALWIAVLVVALVVVALALLLLRRRG